MQSIKRIVEASAVDNREIKELSVDTNTVVISLNKKVSEHYNVLDTVLKQSEVVAQKMNTNNLAINTPISSRFSSIDFPALQNSKRKRQNDTPPATSFASTVQQMSKHTQLNDELNIAVKKRQLIAGNSSKSGLGNAVSLSKPPTVKTQRPEWKSIYVSRIENTVTADDLVEYIKQNIPDVNENDFNVRILVKKDQQIEKLSFVSFRVSSIPDLYVKIFDSSFWPYHTPELKNLNNNDSSTTVPIETSHNLPLDQRNNSFSSLLPITKIDLYYQNLRGLRTKSKRFIRNSTSCDFDIIVLTETWLNNDHFSSEYFDHNFTIFRKDRYETGSALKRGGGVLIAVHNRFACTDVELYNTKDIECICVKISLNAISDVFIYNAYIPPDSPNQLYDEHLSAIKSIKSIHSTLKATDTFIVTGDFNIPNATWTRDDLNSNILLPVQIEPSFAEFFIYEILSLGVHQVNGILNSNNRLLDLVFTNDSTDIEVYKPPPLLNEDEHHPPIQISFEWHLASRAMHEDSFSFNFKKGNYVEMNRFIDNSSTRNHWMKKFKF